MSRSVEIFCACAGFICEMSVKVKERNSAMNKRFIHIVYRIDRLLTNASKLHILIL